MKKITLNSLKNLLREGTSPARRSRISALRRRNESSRLRRGRIVREGTVDEPIEAEVIDDPVDTGASEVVNTGIDVDAVRSAVKELASAVGLEVVDGGATAGAEPEEEIVPVEDDVPVSERRNRVMEARRRAMIRRRRMARR